MAKAVGRNRTSTHSAMECKYAKKQERQHIKISEKLTKIETMTKP